MNKKHIIYALIWGLIAAGVWYLYAQLQPAMDYKLCPMCDGIEYREMKENFDFSIMTVPPPPSHSIAAPFNQRILVPFLAFLTPYETTPSFSLINATFSILTITLLFLAWKKSEFPTFLICSGLLWLLFHWSGIIRYYHFDPLSVDVPVYFFHTLLVLILLSKKHWILPVITPFAMATKESFLAYVVLFVLYALLHNALSEKHFSMKPIWISFVLALATLLTINLLHPVEVNQALPKGMVKFNSNSTSLVNNRNGLVSLLYYTKQVLMNPLHIVRWIVAIFTAFGAFILLSFINVRKHYKANPEQNLILIFSLVSILFGLIAGMDRTRIMMIGAPFVLTSIFYLIRNRGLGVLIAAGILSVPLMRLASVIPPLDAIGYKDWYPEYADLWVVCAWGLYMVFCYFVLSKVEGYFQRKNAKMITEA